MCGLAVATLDLHSLFIFKNLFASATAWRTLSCCLFVVRKIIYAMNLAKSVLCGSCEGLCNPRKYKINWVKLYFSRNFCRPKKSKMNLIDPVVTGTTTCKTHHVFTFVTTINIITAAHSPPCFLWSPFTSMLPLLGQYSVLNSQSALRVLSAISFSRMDICTTVSFSLK